MLSRKKLKVDEVIHVARYRGEPEDFRGKIVAIRDCRARPVEAETERDRRIRRSRYLLTVEALDPNAEKRFRAFYSHYIEEP